MTERNRFDDDNWMALAKAPVGVFGLLTGADRPNPISMLREGRALGKAAEKSHKKADWPPVVHELAEYFVAHGKDFSDGSSTVDSMDALVQSSRQTLVDAGRAAVAMNAEEREAYIEWVLGLAGAMARAVDEKGATDRISADEARALQEIETVLRGT